MPTKKVLAGWLRWREEWTQRERERERQIWLSGRKRLKETDFFFNDQLSFPFRGRTLKVKPSFLSSFFLPDRETRHKKPPFLLSRTE